MNSGINFLIVGLLVQAAGALFLALILAYYYRVYRRGYLKLWGWSWFAFTVYLLGGVFNLLIGHALPIMHPIRVGLSIPIMFAGYVQALWLVTGTWHLRTEKRLTRRTYQWIYLMFLVVVVVTSLLFPGGVDRAAWRFMVRVGTRSLFAGLAFLVCAWGVLRDPRRLNSLGPRLVAGSLFLYGLDQLQYVAISVVNVVWPMNFATIPYTQVLDILLQSVLGVGLVIWLLDEERFRTEAVFRNLREINQMLQTLINTTPLALIVLDQEGRVRLWNPAAEKMFGWIADEVLNRVVPIESPDTPQWWRSFLAEDGANGAEFRDLTLTKRDGGLLEARLSCGRLPLESAEGPQYLVIVRDVTDQKRIERQLQQAARMEALGQMAGGVAHDFNNLMMAMLGSLEILCTRLPPPFRDAEEIKVIRQSIDRAALLTRNLLAFARRQILEPRDLDLNRVLEDMLPMLRRVLPENIELRFFPDTHLGTIHADRVQVEQIVLNLCLNARDAMPEGGVLTLETHNIDIGDRYRATHPWARPGPYVLLSVTDSGIGMDAKTMDRIFEPFFTTKEPGRGTGMGLATVYGIVRQHNGMIHVYSEPGHGTTFKIYMPRVDRPPQEQIEEEWVAVKGGAETILVVEDDEVVREVMVAALQHWGYRVLAAPDGASALEQLKKEEGRVDLVISDVVMPKMGGKALYEAAQKIAPAIRFLFISGYTTNLVHIDFIQRPEIPFLAKPFGLDALARKVREVLDR